LALLALAALLLGACGSTYTKGDYVHQADAICAATLRELRALAPPSFTGTNAQHRLALTAYTERALRIVENERRQLRSLPRPSQPNRQAARLQDYLRALDRAVGDYRSLSSAERAGDTEAAAGATSALAASPIASLAAAYGLRSCASAGATYR
jgi:hypothetical protein